MTDDEVDSEDPRPAGRFAAARDADWFYVDEDRARSVSLGPAGEGLDDWVLTLTAADGESDPPGGAGVAVRLSPTALHELHVEARSVGADARKAGHTAECDLCGETVELRRAVPNDRDRPVHRRCYREAYGGPKWLREE